MAGIQLYDWQKPSRDRLVEIFRGGSKIALNASDMGSGKTFVALDTARMLGLKPLVICPKAVISAWRRASEDMGIPVLDVLNSERLLTMRTPWFKDDKWNVPKDALLAYDEVQKGLAGPDTKTTRAVALTKPQGIPVLAMSATLADSPLKMRALGYLLGLHGFTKASFYKWCFDNGCRRNNWNGVEFPKTRKSTEIMQALHLRVKDRMVRVRIDEIPDFPECDTQVELFDLDKEDTDRVNELYAELETKLQRRHTNPMVDILFARQHVEHCKIKLLHELVLDTLDAGHSAVVFVNFRDTVTTLQSMLAKQGIRASVIMGVTGDKGQRERDQAIADFQSNVNHVALVTAAAGGAGLGLHDLKHERPRRSFINPSYKSDEVRQVLGRIHRVGGSKAIQTFVLAAGTVEEKVYKSVSGKLRNMDSLQDGDLAMVEGEKQ